MCVCVCWSQAAKEGGESGRGLGGTRDEAVGGERCRRVEREGRKEGALVGGCSKQEKNEKEIMAERCHQSSGRAGA